MKVLTEFSCAQVSYRIVRGLDGHKLQSSTQANKWTTIEEGSLKDLLVEFCALIGDAVKGIK